MPGTRTYAAALVVIALVALYLRVDRLDLTEFRLEESNAGLIAARFVDTGRPPLTGIGTSVPGLENGPLLIYLIALPLWLARDGALAAAFIGLLNVGALLVSARFVERVYGRAAALFTAATYAVGTWAVYFSRKIWPNDPMPLFSALLALALLDAVVLGRRRGVALAGLWLGCLLNLHPSSFSLVPFTLLALALRPRLLVSRGAVVGVMAALVVTTPFLIHEVRTGFPALGALRSVAGSTASVDAQALEYAGELVGPGAYAFLATGAEDLFWPRALPLGPLPYALGALVALGVLVALGRLGRTWRAGGEWRAEALPLLWLAVPLAIASRRSIPLWIHYLIFLIPALFPFVGLALATPRRLARNAGPIARGLAVVAPCLLVAWAAVVQIQHHLLYWDVLDQAAMRTIYGAPWGAQRGAADRALAAANGAPIVLVSQPAPFAGADDLVPVWRFLIPERIPLRFDDGSGVLRLTDRDSVYVVAPTADPRAAQLLAAYGSAAAPPFHLAGLPQPGFADGYAYFRARAQPDAEPGAGLARLEDGLRLQRVAYPPRIDPGRDLAVSADWRVDARPANEELGFFTHLVDDRLERTDGADRAGVAGGELSAGDQLVTWATLHPPAALPPGRYWLMLGAYRAQGTRRLAVLDGAGRSVGDFARVGPLKVALPAVGPVDGTLARFVGGIELAAAAFAPGRVDLTWRATARPAVDLTVFVHLVDADGKLVGQDDRAPMGGRYPTSIWDAGETIPDPHPVNAPPGRYRVLVGLYDPTSGARLARADAPGDSAEIGIAEVARTP